MFRPKIKLDVFFSARKAADELSAGRWWGGSDLEETRKHVFRGERGPGPPNFGPRLISTCQNGGSGPLSPLKTFFLVSWLCSQAQPQS